MCRYQIYWIYITKSNNETTIIVHHSKNVNKSNIILQEFSFFRNVVKVKNYLKRSQNNLASLQMLNKAKEEYKYLLSSTIKINPKQN